MARPILHLPPDITDDAFLDLRAALQWGSGLELTDEQRAELIPLCIKITQLSELRREREEARIPSWRLKEEADAKRAALARAEKAEQRVAELEAKMPGELEPKTQRRWWHLSI
jgi:hypothetical protein